ncbi:hypothetical protein [Amycolatopsis decaplanina]|uniref:Uncharacterized protein n=1 Tax=Amycolatopsis decaplanina DSM 44594 TaxID=1284240 RepID=M2ZYR8_9PSEU|nr:hypothetical protein [Amycolatopsis decaplanina]EME65863.1 hypothetical protein H074_00030 [Amycolatopsis decaplanina DSM 44594]
MTGAAWVALAALTVSLAQAIIHLIRFYKVKAKAELSAHGLERYVTTPWSSRTGSAADGTHKQIFPELVIVNHGPHEATDIVVQLLDRELAPIVDLSQAFMFHPGKTDRGENDWRRELRILHPRQEIVLALIAADQVPFPAAVRLSWRDGRRREQEAQWLTPPRWLSEP